MKINQNIPTYLDSNQIPEYMASRLDCRRAGLLIKSIQPHQAVYSDDTDSLGKEVRLYDIRILQRDHKKRRFNNLIDPEIVYLIEAFKSNKIKKTSMRWEILKDRKRSEKDKYKPEIHLLTGHVIRLFDPELSREMKSLNLGKVVTDTRYGHTYHLIFSDLAKVVSYLKSINASIKSNINNN